MTILDGLRMAIRSILANRTRSSLTILGLLIGVSSVIALIAVGQGAQEGVKARISNLGTDLLFIRPVASSSGNVRGSANSGATIFAEDAEAIRNASIPGILHVAPQLNFNAQAIAGENNQQVSIIGTDHEFLPARDLIIESGSFISEKDVKNSALSMVLGSDIASSLFLEDDPIGENVRLSFGGGRISFNFRVTGVLQEIGGESQQDNYVFIPVTTLQSRIRALRNTSGNTIINQITLRSSPGINQDSVSTLVSDFLTAHHNKQEPDFTITSQTQLLEAASKVNAVLTLLLGSVAGISLCVGAIGVMNIMLVSVTERTREIGIRRAVGATSPDIALQFLLEAVTLSVCGGLIGIIVGIAGAELVNEKEILGEVMTTVIQPWSIILAFFVAVIVGIVSGIYPAYRAALLDPIVALRNE
ncbi:MAG: hypothetical protein CL785_01945 [Chloroflexi bacterium]|nr:hypothetical protein [Chloroflexota bacterium]|tara:strand:- start:1274 stop:2524 length:1251 start_codon:yes stop_codon:yes gene_type:complete